MSCKEPGRGTIPSVFKQFLFYGLLGLVLVALLPGTAKAEPEWCVRELSRSDESVVVQHNPECDLRILTRMYPQKDDDGKVLPEQVQLRSLFAANQTRVVDGVTYRYTVMRACVKPGKPSKDADEEELKLCPRGLRNLFRHRHRIVQLGLLFRPSVSLLLQSRIWHLLKPLVLSCKTNLL